MPHTILNCAKKKKEIGIHSYPPHNNCYFKFKVLRNSVDGASNLMIKMQNLMCIILSS